ncbi:MAG: YbjQ family protein [Coriobacteriales bacterium]|nr:YbjQ family protein [Coriobacteriales bacterium]
MINPAAVFVVTTENVPGYRVVSVLGEVFGVSSRSRNRVATQGAGLVMVSGGELDSFTDLVAECRYEALERMRLAAAERGANAVLALRFDTENMGDSGGAAIAYGTAVVLSRQPDA